MPDFICIFIYLIFTSLFIHSFINLFIHLFTYLIAYLFIYLFIYLHTHSFIHDSFLKTLSLKFLNIVNLTYFYETEIKIIRKKDAHFNNRG